MKILLWYFLWLFFAASFAYAGKKGSSYVGSLVCQECHSKISHKWQASHHGLAMQEVGPLSVLGDFGNARFKEGEKSAFFFKKEEGYYVKTDGIDGKEAVFKVAYVFGVYPLQQYLVKFDGGRYQVLHLCWDARPKKEGGQRWFHLYPKEGSDSELHWTKPLFTWNHMCAECHVTDFQKGYDREKSAYKTLFSEIGVGCESCHGPGRKHVAFMQSGQKKGHGLLWDLGENSRGSWQFMPGEKIARRQKPLANHKTTNLCSHCHSRRTPLRASRIAPKDLLDGYSPALIAPPEYYLDGQIKEEVYVWGSFLQSKMYQKGVTCGDCHDPHSLEQKRQNPDATCLKCHKADYYASRKHHHHDPLQKGGSCISCHMPAKVYMKVDKRRDHSFRIPRPDVSLLVGSPDTCTSCHEGKDALWAQKAIKKWYPDGRWRRPHFSAAFLKGQNGEPGAANELIGVLENKSLAPIIRASAAAFLGRFTPDKAVIAALTEASQNQKEPLIRYGVAKALNRAAPPKAFGAPIWDLIGDEYLAVRVEAGRAASYQVGQFSAEKRLFLEKAVARTIAAEMENADTGEGNYNAALLYLAMGKVKDAEAFYRRALAINPQYVPAKLNLADLYRATRRDKEAEKWLVSATKDQPKNPTSWLSYGLWAIRQGDGETAKRALAKAASIKPYDAYAAYVYGVFLQSLGESSRAEKVWLSGLKEHPYDRNLLEALYSYYLDRGEQFKAQKIYLRLLSL